MIIKKEENSFVFLLLTFSDPPRPPKKAMPIIKDKFSRSKEECANTIVA
jgi:hypothetical protein